MKAITLIPALLMTLQSGPVLAEEKNIGEIIEYALGIQADLYGIKILFPNYSPTDKISSKLFCSIHTKPRAEPIVKK